MRQRSLLTIIATAAGIAIVIASILVRLGGPADPAADIGDQRAAVNRFHELVVDRRWGDVYRSTTEPPARNAAEFSRLMDAQVRENGRVIAVETQAMRLLRSRTVPLLEVDETVRTSRGTSRMTSYFAFRNREWLFAFSAPRT